MRCYNYLMAIAALAAWCASPLVAADPAAPGPFTVVEEGYDFGFQAWSDPYHDLALDFTAAVYRPAEMEAGPFPLVLIAHGRHSVTYDVATGDVPYYPSWPPQPGEAALPNHRGYDWLATTMASHGCFVVSVRIAGFGYHDDNLDDGGSEARARLLRAHLAFLRQASIGTVTPVGDRYLGCIDTERLAVVGHSRGGTGVVAFTRLLQDLGEDEALRAVLAIAPSNLNRKVLRGVPLGILLGYLDGDVNDLGGVHHYDDARAGDPAPRYMFTIMGGNHNQFNSYWDPDVFAPGASRDGPTPDYAIDGATQRAVAAVWCAAFLRRYLLDDARWQGVLTGDEPLPGDLAAVAVRPVWYPPAADRRRLNSSLQIDQATRGDDDGSAADRGDLTVTTFGGGDPLPDCLVHEDEPPYGYTGTTFYQEPHWDYNGGLRQLLLRWDGDDGDWIQHVSAGRGDWRDYDHLALRIGIDFTDALNPVDESQDLSLALTDGDGTSQRVALSAHGAAALEYPYTSENYIHPKIMLFQVRVPLTAYDTVDLGQVASVGLHCDRNASGQVVVTDLLLERAGVPTWDASLSMPESAAVGATVAAQVDGAPDGASVRWCWGDGATALGTDDATHAWNAPGRYVVSARVMADGVHQLVRGAVRIDPPGGNSAPTITGLADITVDQGASVAPVAFTIGDAESAADDLVLRVHSDDEVVLPRERIRLARDGTACQLDLRPMPTVTGSSVVQVTVDDGEHSVSQTFTLTVPPVAGGDRLPTIPHVRSTARLTLDRDLETWQVAGSDCDIMVWLHQIDQATDPFDVTLSVSSSDEALLPADAVTLTRDPDRETRFTATVPVPDVIDAAVRLKITADDGVHQRACHLDLHIIAAPNQAPEIIAQPTATPAETAVATAITLEVAANDPDDGPVPLSYFWIMRNWAPGFMREGREWAIADNGTPLARRTTVDGLTVSGSYVFEVRITDGIDTVTSEQVTVTIGDAVSACRAYWPLDEMRGLRRTRPTDGPVLVSQGAVSWAPGRDGLAAFIVDDAAHLRAQADGLQTLAVHEAATWSLHLRPAAVDGRRTIAARHAADDPGWLLQLDDGRLQMTVHGASGSCTVRDDQALAADAWVHVAAVYDGQASSLVLYRDGAPVAETEVAVPSAVRKSAAALTLAGATGDGDTGWRGRLDDLRIYDAALDADTVAELAATPTDRPPLVRWVAPAASYWAGTTSTVPLALNAIDPDGDPVRLSLYRLGAADGGYRPIEVLVDLPVGAYRWTWQDPPLGVHRLIAVADHDGSRISSPPLDLWIGSPGPQPITAGERRVLLERRDAPWLWEHVEGRGVPLIGDEYEEFRDLDPAHDHPFRLLPTWDN